MSLTKGLETLVCIVPAVFIALFLRHSGPFFPPMSAAELQAIHVGEPTNNCSPQQGNNSCCCIQGTFTACTTPICISNPSCPKGHIVGPTCTNASCTVLTDPPDPNSNCTTPNNQPIINAALCTLTGETVPCPYPLNTFSCWYTTDEVQFQGINNQCNAQQSLCASGQPVSPCPTS